MSTLTQEFTKGLWKEIPPFRFVLGLCPALGVTTTMENGLGMGLGFTLSLMVLGGVREILGSGSLLAAGGAAEGEGAALPAAGADGSAGGGGTAAGGAALTAGGLVELKTAKQARHHITNTLTDQLLVRVMLTTRQAISDNRCKQRINTTQHA